jgi:2'-5' RNA ligase
MRAFYAVKVTPTPPIRRLLTRLRVLGGRLRPVASNQLHLTLKFLGNVPDEWAPELERILQQSVAGESACSLQFRGLGAFPNDRRPAVVWIGVEPQPVLTRIVQRLEAAVASLGIAPETRPFQPHLTVLRIRARPPAALFEMFSEHAATDFGEVPVHAAELVRSELSAHGAVHTVVASAALMDSSSQDSSLPERHSSL